MRINRRWRTSRLALVVGLVLAFGLAAVATASPPTQTFTGQVSPSKLPKRSFAPVRAHFDLDIHSTDAALPPKLQTATIQFDNQVKVDAKGLPTCPTAKLENTDTPSARKACGDAIIGTGFANAKVQFPDQAPIDAPSGITLFNGPPQGGNPVIIIHAYITVPAPTTFIVPGVLHKAGGGLQVTFQVPPIAGGYGTLVHFDTSINRRYKVGGKTKSYALAKCSKGKFTLGGSFTYDDGTTNPSSFIAPCKGT
jgi:hypothetical protein